MTMNTTADHNINRRLGDSYAIAILQWPAVIGFLEAPEDGLGSAVKWTCAAWVVVTVLTITFGRGEAGSRFGVAMSICAALVAAFWLAHPGGLMYVWLALLLLCFFAAQRARVAEPHIADAKGSERKPA